MAASADSDVVYSCVVDATPTLYHQVMVWAWTAVDLAGIANPPLELLAPLFSAAGFPAVPTVGVSIGSAHTFQSNCNGGLYLLSGGWLRRLQEPWPRWVRWVEGRADDLGPYRVHAFQVAFA